MTFSFYTITNHLLEWSWMLCTWYMVYVSWRLMTWNNFFIICYEFQTKSKCVNFYQAQYISATTQINKIIKKIKDIFYAVFFHFIDIVALGSTFQFRLDFRLPQANVRFASRVGRSGFFCFGEDQSCSQVLTAFWYKLDPRKKNLYPQLSF